MTEQEKQCRICLDGVEAERELGRLIRPCLCKGSISYVHIECLNRWRKTSSSDSAFFACPQCHYQYRFARTQIFGLAANPIIVGSLSGLLFTCIVMAASFITTFFMGAFETPTTYNSFYYISPIDVAQDLITAIFRIIRDGDIFDFFTEPIGLSRNSPLATATRPDQPPPGIIKGFIRRFLIGLPLVGAGSVVHMLLSFQMLAPVQFVARYRASRSRRNNSKDFAALIIVALVVAGAVRALYKVYKLTEILTRRMLMRAEDAILEVN